MALDVVWGSCGLKATKELCESECVFFGYTTR